MLPANRELAGAEIELVDFDNREARLRKALQAVQSDYDFVLIDSPPSLSILTLNGLCAANGVVIPMQCEYFALEGLSDLVNTIRKVHANFNTSIRIIGILRVMFDGRMTLSQQVSAQLEAHFKDKVFTAVVPRNVRLAEAPSHGLPGVVFDESSRGAQAYLAFAAELIQKMPLFGVDSAPSPSTHSRPSPNLQHAPSPPMPAAVGSATAAAVPVGPATTAAVSIGSAVAVAAVPRGPTSESLATGGPTPGAPTPGAPTPSAPIPGGSTPVEVAAPASNAGTPVSATQAESPHEGLDRSEHSPTATGPEPVPINAEAASSAEPRVPAGDPAAEPGESGKSGNSSERPLSRIEPNGSDDASPLSPVAAGLGSVAVGSGSGATAHSAGLEPPDSTVGRSSAGEYAPTNLTGQSEPELETLPSRHPNVQSIAPLGAQPEVQYAARLEAPAEVPSAAPAEPEAEVQSATLPESQPDVQPAAAREAQPEFQSAAPEDHSAAPPEDSPGSQPIDRSDAAQPFETNGVTTTEAVVTHLSVAPAAEPTAFPDRPQADGDANADWDSPDSLVAVRSDDGRFAAPSTAPALAGQGGPSATGSPTEVATAARLDPIGDDMAEAAATAEADTHFSPHPDAMSEARDDPDNAGDSNRGRWQGGE